MEGWKNGKCIKGRRRNIGNKVEEVKVVKEVGKYEKNKWRIKGKR